MPRIDRKIKVATEVVKITYMPPMKMGNGPWKPPHKRKKGKRNAAG